MFPTVKATDGFTRLATATTQRTKRKMNPPIGGVVVKIFFTILAAENQCWQAFGFFTTKKTFFTMEIYTE
jgi:hypothetical protein